MMQMASGEPPPNLLPLLADHPTHPHTLPRAVEPASRRGDMAVLIERTTALWHQVDVQMEPFRNLVDSVRSVVGHAEHPYAIDGQQLAQIQEGVAGGLERGGGCAFLHATLSDVNRATALCLTQ